LSDFTFILVTKKFRAFSLICDYFLEIPLTKEAEAGRQHILSCLKHTAPYAAYEASKKDSWKKARAVRAIFEVKMQTYLQI
jgi:hypothetical protein